MIKSKSYIAIFFESLTPEQKELFVSACTNLVSNVFAAKSMDDAQKCYDQWRTNHEIKSLKSFVEL